MKYKYILTSILFISIIEISNGQEITDVRKSFIEFNKRFKNYDKVGIDSNLYYFKRVWSKNSPKNHSNFMTKRTNRQDSSFYYNTVGAPLIRILYSHEHDLYKSELDSINKKLILELNQPFSLVLLKQALINYDSSEKLPNFAFFQDKLMQFIDYRGNKLEKINSNYYSYTKFKKEVIKFVSINTGNDLFRPGAYLNDAYYGEKTNRSIFQRNLDRDYTGSLNVEIATDYLNFQKRKPFKSYQTLSWGFNVYTPSFTNEAIFKNDTSYAEVNGKKMDRPHAAYSYIGWSRFKLKTLLKHSYESSSQFKIGIIGGKIGEIFQNNLHQDISGSLRPKGWTASIAYPGRLALIYRKTGGFQIFEGPNKFPVKTTLLYDAQIGTVKLYSGIGIKFSNKSLSENNQHFINHRTKDEVSSWREHLMWSLSFNLQRVVHNSLYSGYGDVFTSEIRDRKNKRYDPYTPISKYILGDENVRKWNSNVNFRLSYTTSFVTYFYNFFVFSPETKGLGLDRFKHYDNWVNINLDTFRHRYAQIGINFKI